MNRNKEKKCDEKGRQEKERREKKRHKNNRRDRNNQKEKEENQLKEMRKEEKDRIGEQSIGQYVTVLTWNTECICASYHPPILAEYTCKYGISKKIRTT